MKADIFLVPLGAGSTERDAEEAPDRLFSEGIAGRLEERGHSVSSVTEILPVRGSGFTDPLIEDMDVLVPTLRKLSEASALSAERDAFSLFIGGGRSVSLGAVAGLSDGWGREDTTLIWIDSSPSSNTPFSSPVHEAGRMVVSSLLGYGESLLSSGIGKKGPKLMPDNVILIGPRRLDAAEQAFLVEHGVTCFRMGDIRMMGLDRVMESVKNSIRTEHAAVAFSASVMDPAIFSSVTDPVPDGLTIDDACYILNRLVMDGRVGALSVTDQCPFLDDDGRDMKTLLYIIGKAFSSFL